MSAKLPSDQKRRQRGIPISDQEWALVKAAAAKQGVSASALARGAMVRSAKTVLGLERPAGWHTTMETLEVTGTS
tara:strand:- start:1 stop:225 length:225 start_codon:yes stop_codon:yes gene_type:complete